MCSAPRILEERDDSPSYTLVFPFSIQVSHSIFYPTLSELHWNFIYWEVSDLQIKHFFRSHFNIGKGSFLTKKFFSWTPPSSTILILVILFLLISCSLCLNSLARRGPLVAGTNNTVVYNTSFSPFPSFLYQFTLFRTQPHFPSIFIAKLSLKA